MSKKNNFEPEITSSQKFDIPELVRFSLLENAMDSIEQAGSNLTGAEKKQWVLEFAAKEIKEVLSRPDYWLPKIMQWIDIFKTAFNALKALF